jgi:hypothetical protein
MLVNNKLKRTWKKAAMNYFKTCLGISMGTEESHKIY